MTPVQYFEKDGSMSKSEVARALGVTPSAIGHYVTGRRTPSKEDAAMIAKVTGEPALYAYWYPSYKQQLERMSLTPPAAQGTEEVSCG